MRPILIPLMAALMVSSAAAETLTRRAVIDKYCLGCHSRKLKTGGVVLEGLDTEQVGQNAGAWERVLRKVRAGQMPPTGMARADAASTTAFVAGLEQSLDQ